jgi:hypothetical protein
MVNAGDVQVNLSFNISSLSSGMSKVTKELTGLERQLNSLNKAAGLGNLTNLGKNLSNLGSGVNNLTNKTKELGTSTQSATANATKGFQNLVGQMDKAQTAFNETVRKSNNMASAVTITTSSMGTLGATTSKTGLTASGVFSQMTGGLRNVGSSITSLMGNWSNFTQSFMNFGIWFGAMGVAALGKFTVGAAMAREEAMSTFEFMGMAKGEIDGLSKASEQYAISASKVSNDEMLSALSKVYSSHKMNTSALQANIPVIGDLIAKYKSEGRTASEAVLAINDGLDGQAKRLQELGISIDDLKAHGWSGLNSDAEGYFNAMEAIFSERGWTGWASKMLSTQDKLDMLSEKLQKAGADIGYTMLPALTAGTEAFIQLSDAIGSTATGLAIVTPAIAVILGFLWEPITIAAGGFMWLSRAIGLTSVAHGAYGIVSNLTQIAMGKEIATGTLLSASKIELAAVTEAAAHSNQVQNLSNANLVESNKGLRASIASLLTPVGALAIGIAAVAAAAVAFVYISQQNMSASVAWGEVEQQRNEQISAFTNTIQSLNDKKANLISKREALIAQGADVTEINRQISDTEAAISSNTKASADAAERYNKAMETKKALEGYGEQKITDSKVRFEAAKMGVTPEEYLKVYSDPDVQKGMERTADLNAKIYTVFDRGAGTIDKIKNSTDTYSQKMKTAYDGKFFTQYEQDYADFVSSNEKFQLAWDKGDWGGIIREGIMSAVFQARIGFKELQVSIWSAWDDFWKDQKDQVDQGRIDAENAIKKPFQDAYLSIMSGWNGLGAYFQGAWNDITAGLKKGWDDIVKYFNDPSTIGGGVLDSLRKIYCMIMGCSPGIVPALGIMFNTAKGIFNKLKAMVSPLIKPFKDLADIISSIFGGKGVGGGGFSLGSLNIGAILRDKIPMLKWKLPNVTQVLQSIWNKINPLKWNIPGVGDLLGQTWQKIQHLFWNIPNPADFLAQTWQKITQLIWDIPTAGQILDYIKAIIPAFSWPWGPGGGTRASNVATNIGNRARAALPGGPRGPLTSMVSGAISSMSGLGQGNIESAMSKRFKGISAFTDIADAMASHLSYEFYMGDQKSNRQVWDSGTCNCYDGAQFLMDEASRKMGLGAGLSNGLWDGTSIPHTWATIGGQPFDMAGMLLRGSWSPPSGPGADFAQFMTDIGPGLEYLGYGGHLKDPYSALSNGGNCFDMTLGVMGIANQLFGLPAEMVWGNWEGQSHVWAKVGNREYDPARMAINRTYSPPPQGPRGDYGGGDVFNIEFSGTVYGVDDLAGRTESMVNQALENREARRKRRTFG